MRKKVIYVFFATSCSWLFALQNSNVIALVKDMHTFQSLCINFVLRSCETNGGKKPLAYRSDLIGIFGISFFPCLLHLTLEESFYLNLVTDSLLMMRWSVSGAQRTSNSLSTTWKYLTNQRYPHLGVQLLFPMLQTMAVLMHPFVCLSSGDITPVIHL